MAKKKRTPKKSTQAHKLYDQGKLKAKSCPKCGAGVFMAAHKDRHTCGKCKYTEFKK